MSKHSIQNDPEIQQWMENERIDYLIKSEAIGFAKFITNDTTFNDFVFMSKEIQEEIYQQFKNENKHKELDSTDKKLHISDVSCSSISREDINKQAYLVMSNINATKIMTNISDKNHETLMNSFFTLRGMFNDYLKQNGVD